MHCLCFCRSTKKPRWRTDDWLVYFHLCTPLTAVYWGRDTSCLPSFQIIWLTTINCITKFNPSFSLFSSGFYRFIWKLRCGCNVKNGSVPSVLVPLFLIMKMWFYLRKTNTKISTNISTHCLSIYSTWVASVQFFS